MSITNIAIVYDAGKKQWLTTVGKYSQGAGVYNSIEKALSDLTNHADSLLDPTDVEASLTVVITWNPTDEQLSNAHEILERGIN